MLRRTLVTALIISPLAACIAEDEQQPAPVLLDADFVDTWVGVTPNIAEAELTLREDGSAHYSDATHDITIRWEMKGAELYLTSDVLGDPDVDKVGPQYTSHLKTDGTLILRDDKSDALYVLIRKHIHVQNSAHL